MNVFIRPFCYYKTFINCDVSFIVIVLPVAAQTRDAIMILCAVQRDQLVRHLLVSQTPGQWLLPYCQYVSSLCHQGHFLTNRCDW